MENVNRRSAMALGLTAAAATPLLALRTERLDSFEELLAGLIFMGDDRLVETAYIEGRVVHAQTSPRRESLPALP